MPSEEGERQYNPVFAAEDIDIAARRVIEEAGYGGYFNNRLGHGIGIAIHEAPNIIRETGWLWPKGWLSA
jgi:Xaa-Pro aminopeptidase